MEDGITYYVLVIENDRIVKILPTKTRAEFRAVIVSEPEDSEISMLTCYDNKPCPYVVGDFAPNTGDNETNCVAIQRKTDRAEAEKRARDWAPHEDDYEKRLELSLKFLKNVKGKSDFISEIRKQYEENIAAMDNNEAVYRCFYNSFKMYRVRQNMLDYSRMALLLVGGTPSKNDRELVQQLEEYKFSKIYVQLVKDSIASDFNLNRNEHSAWVRDAQVIFSAYFLISKALLFIIQFAERINDKSLFVLYSRSLDWDEAGAMEVLDSISILRYRKEAQEEFKKQL